MAGDAASVVAAATRGILDRTGDLIEFLAPTVTELAFGAMDRFLDLAGFLGGNLADVGDFAGALAGGLAGGLGAALTGVWALIARGMLAFLRLLLSPLRAGSHFAFGSLPGPAL